LKVAMTVGMRTKVKAGIRYAMADILAGARKQVKEWSGPL
jgi:hypothetical protein